MPHPEHAVDAADRLRRRAEAVPVGRPGARVSKHRELGLTDSEYDLIVEKLGREPNEVELAVFSLMWSEHCGYKHSRRLLKTLPTEGPRLVLGPGENAGAVSVGDGLACAFKVESHNHPSAVEPFEGAATGVGGILRDIFAIGARPIAILDSLRFGEVGHVRPLALPARARGGGDRPLRQLDRDRDRRRRDLLRGPVRAELPRQRDGARADRDRQADPERGRGRRQRRRAVRRARPAATGSAARRCWPRAELDDSEDKRPTVQIGDPFEEKKLLECSLELLERGLLVALQDLGAAGLTSSSAEMAAKGEVGLDLDVRRVPLREADMEAVRDHGLGVPGADAVRRRARSRCRRCWPSARAGRSTATAIGEVTDTRRLRVFDGDDAGRRHAGHGARRRVPGLRPRARRARDAAVPGAASRC